jgi:hypothetical protein
MVVEVVDPDGVIDVSSFFTQLRCNVHVDDTLRPPRNIGGSQQFVSRGTETPTVTEGVCDVMMAGDTLMVAFLMPAMRSMAIARLVASDV